MGHQAHGPDIQLIKSHSWRAVAMRWDVLDIFPQPSEALGFLAVLVGD